MASGAVLIAEDDPFIAEVVRVVLEVVLEEEGYTAHVLQDTASQSLRATVERLEPDCVLLDGQGQSGFGRSWADAAWLCSRPRPLPAVVFTADSAAVLEAKGGMSERARAAAFAAAIAKPFDRDELLDGVRRIVDGTGGTTASLPRLTAPPAE
jgi:CheY-like chemotaxis protein